MDHKHGELRQRHRSTLADNPLTEDSILPAESNLSQLNSPREFSYISYETGDETRQMTTKLEENVTREEAAGNEDFQGKNSEVNKNKNTEQDSNAKGELQEERHLGERPRDGFVDLEGLKDSTENILRQINEIAHKNVDIMFKSSVRDIEPSDEDPKFPYFELLKHLEKKYSDHEVERFAKNLEEIVTKKELQRIITTLLVIFWVKVFCKINDDFPKKKWRRCFANNHIDP